MSSLFYSSWSEEIKCAYAAGAIDSDGCISFMSGSNRIQVQFAQTVKGSSLTDFMTNEFGAKSGTRKSKGDRQDMIMCFWHAKHAHRFIKQINPYLVFKRDQAKIAIEYCEFMENRSGAWTPRHYQYAMEVKETFAFLNRKGRTKNKETQLPPRPQPQVSNEFQRVLFDFDCF